MARKTKSETEKTTEKPAHKPAGKTPTTAKAENVESGASPAPAAQSQPASSEASPRRAPTHEEISRRAHELWVRRGGVGGTAQDDWLRAERELRAAASR